MAVKPMTAQGQWVCFGPDRALAYKIDTGRVIPFESTPTGWNLTVELEAPENANKKLQEAMDTKIAKMKTILKDLDSITKYNTKQLVDNMNKNKVLHNNIFLVLVLRQILVLKQNLIKEKFDVKADRAKHHREGRVQ